MLKAIKIIALLLLLITLTMATEAQESKLSYDGNIRISHLGNDSEPGGWEAITLPFACALARDIKSIQTAYFVYV